MKAYGWNPQIDGDAYWAARDEENDRRWFEEADPEFEAAYA